MNQPLWVVELADIFWSQAGMLEPFPRALRRPIARALPAVVVSLPELRCSSVQSWVTANRGWCPCLVEDRRLRGCLVARDGWGYIFLDGADSEDEQRLSLAHELAHFLRHYWQPRQRARQRLGNQVLEVLDGLRHPTQDERFRGILAEVPLGFHWHLLDRHGDGTFPSAALATAEEEADRLAYELLAPAVEVFRLAGAAPGQIDRVSMERLLQSAFGLPGRHATRYAKQLLPGDSEDAFLQGLLVFPR